MNTLHFRRVLLHLLFSCFGKTFYCCCFLFFSHRFATTTNLFLWFFKTCFSTQLLFNYFTIHSRYLSLNLQIDSTTLEKNVKHFFSGLRLQTTIQSTHACEHPSRRVHLPMLSDIAFPC